MRGGCYFAWCCLFLRVMERHCETCCLLLGRVNERDGGYCSRDWKECSAACFSRQCDVVVVWCFCMLITEKYIDT